MYKFLSRVQKRCVRFKIGFWLPEFNMTSGVECIFAQRLQTKIQRRGGLRMPYINIKMM